MFYPVFDLWVCWKIGYAKIQWFIMFPVQISVFYLLTEHNLEAFGGYLSFRYTHPIISHVVGLPLSPTNPPSSCRDRTEAVRSR